MRSVKLVGVVLVAALMLLPAVFLRSTPVHAAGLPLWTAVQKLNAPQWTGSGVIISMRPSLTAIDSCNVAMVTAKHVASEEVALVEGGPEMEKMGPSNERRVTPVRGLRWGEAVATAILLHPTQDMAVAVFTLPKPCGLLPNGAVSVNTRLQLAPLAPLLHVGYPYGLLMISKGSYVGPTDQVPGEVLHTSTSMGGPGSSGGAIFSEGQLVGILVRGENRPPFRNLFAPMMYLTDIWPTQA